MSLFTMFDKKPVSKSGSFRITEKGIGSIQKYAQSSSEGDLGIILLSIEGGGSQSIVSLHRTTGLPPDRIKKSLDRLARAGLIAPVSREF